ncbi:MAG: hypothetical protein IKJ29_08720 [Akkermansia sp.]|nr:hypothetical protein [Akkermansia sp.]
MKHLLLSIAFGIFSASAPAQELPANHVDLTDSILDFLSRTELCLNSCNDAQSIEAALPQLQQLSEECGKLVDAQRALPEPTVQDYMAVQNKMEAFTTIWNAIRAHIERLEENKLMTPELREILRVAPPAP